MPSRRPGPSQTSTQESTTQGDEEQRFAEVRIILMDYLRLFTLLFPCFQKTRRLFRSYCLFLSQIFPLSIIYSC